ncbi:hypothetical protein ACLK2I_17320 [Escherichia coli]
MVKIYRKETESSMKKKEIKRNLSLLKEKAREVKGIAGCGVNTLSGLTVTYVGRIRRISVASDTAAQIKTKEKEGLTGEVKA